MAALDSEPDSLPSKPAAESESILVRWMGLGDANSGGFVHGGVVMRLCDEAAGIAAVRHCGGRVVTAAIPAASSQRRITTPPCTKPPELASPSPIQRTRIDSDSAAGFGFVESGSESGAATRRCYPASSFARANTASSIGSVSRPVNVFCWLG